MSEVIRINSRTLNNYFNDFAREATNFTNTSYNGFKSSYLNTCGDTYVRRMASNLNPLYIKISAGYENINTWWNKYVKEVEATENSITNNSISGVSEGAVISALSVLPKLQDFKIRGLIYSLSGIKTDNLDVKTNNNIFNNLQNIFGEIKVTAEGCSANVISSISNVKSKAMDWWNNEAVPLLEKGADAYINTVQNVLNVVGKTGKTIFGTIDSALLSLVEGVGKFGEAVIDTGATISSMSAQATMFEQENELRFYGINTGLDLEKYNKNVQEATQSFVSKEYVTGWFDNFYNNEYGKTIKDNTFAFDTVRSIGNGVGYMAGTTALSMFTFGGSAAGIASTAATAGVGKGAEEAWKNGATYNEGLTYGAATGAWEGLQYYVGAKLIGQSNIFGREGSKLFIDGSKGKVLESAARVVMDAIDSGSEGIVQPFLQSLYVDGYYDENGDYINFSGEDSFAKIWYETFLDNGGWTNVATQAAMGGIGSAIGEALDLGKYFKDSKNTTQSMKDVIDDLEITEPVFGTTDVYSDFKKHHADLFTDGGSPWDITEPIHPIKNTEVTADAFDWTADATAKPLNPFKDTEVTEKVYNEPKVDSLFPAGKTPFDVTEPASSTIVTMNAFEEPKSIFYEDMPGIDYKSAPKGKVVDGVQKFSIDFHDGVAQMGEYYGDAGERINILLKKEKSVQKVLDMLEGQERENFKNFLDNTIEGRYLSSLSEEQFGALITYTGGSYSTINGELRTNEVLRGTYDKIRHNYLKDITENMDSAIKAYGGIDRTTEVYRGVSVTSFTHTKGREQLFDGIDTSDLNQVFAVLKTLEGQDHHDFGYMSASPGYTASFAKHSFYPVVLDIITPEGTPGAYINQISDFYNEENEFLFARDTHLKILEVLPPGKDCLGNEKIVVKCIVG